MTREQLDRLLAPEKNKTLDSDLDALDNRELELFSLLAQGAPTSHICDELQITREELGAMKVSIQKKLGLKDQVKLIQFIAKRGSAS